MGTGYTRNDTANNIADGNIINASDLDGEFDAVQSAFDASTGHTHDGTAGEGAPIETIGPSQDVVATASVLRPKTDNTVDLGTTSLEYKDLFLDGTAHIDTLDVDENASITGTLGVTGTTTLGTANITTGTITTADINGGNIDGTIIGASSAAAITGTTITGTSFVTSGDMTFGDNNKAIFGAGSDLQIYHDGSHSYIHDNGTGDLIVRAENFRLTDAGNTEFMMQAVPNGAVTLYHNGSSKLATTSTGVDITGTLTSDGLQTVNGSNIDMDADASGQLELDGDGYASAIALNADGMNVYTNSAVRGVILGTNETQRLRVGGNGDISFYEDTGTTAKFFWDASAERLGIGTSSPASALHIDAADSATGGFRMKNTAGESVEFYYASSAADADFIINRTGSGAADIGLTHTGDVYFTSGSVGIGTSSPSYPLHVSGTGDKVMAVTAGASSVAALNLGNSTNLADGGIRYDNSADALIFRASNAEKMRIDSSGNLLVGTTLTPTSLNSTSTEEGMAIGGDGLVVIANDGQSPLVLNRLSSDGNILNFNKDGTTVGSIASRSGVVSTVVLNPASGNGAGLSGGTKAVVPADEAGIIDNDISLGVSTHRFKDLYLSGGLRGDTTFKNNAGTTEYARFDSSGNLLVGKTTASTSTAGGEIRSHGGIVAVRDDQWCGLFNRLTGDGELLRFQKDGTTVGSVGAFNGDLSVGTGDTALRFHDGGNRIEPFNISTNANTDGAVDLGVSGARFKDLYLSGGVYLGGVGSSNKLGDYETGTWIIGTNGDATGALGANAYGLYVKIGQLVYIQGVFQVSTNFTSNSIDGLPFVPINNSILDSSLHGQGNLRYGNNNGAITLSSSSDTLAFSDSTGANVVPTTSNDPFRFSATYRTTS